MRSFLVLSLLIIPAYGDGSSNCSVTPGLVGNLTLSYTEQQVVEVTWPASSKSCVAVYRVCLAAGQDAASCQDTEHTSWEGRANRTCANYTLAVAALDADGDLLDEENTTFLSPPAPVANLKVTKRSSSSLLVSWDAGAHDSCVEEYTLSWRQSTDVVAEGSGRAAAADSSYEVGDLNACSLYTVTLRAVFSSGEGSVVQSVSAYTAVKGYPAEVSGLTLTNVTSSAASVQWSASPSCIEQYDVCVRQFLQTNASCTLVPSSRLQWTSPADLRPCTNYSVGVAAVDYSGKASGQSRKTFTTAPGIVRSLHVTGRTADSASVAWQGPDGDASCLKGYELYICAHGGSSTTTCDTLVAELAPGDTSYDATGLASCEDYEVVVKSVGAENQRSVGASVASYTDASNSSAVISGFSTETYLEPGKAGAALVLEANWTTSGDVGCIGGYRVCSREGGDDGGTRKTCEDVDASARQWTQRADFCANYTVEMTPTTVGGRRYRRLSASVVAPPDAVRDLATSDAGVGVIHVSWRAPLRASSSSGCVRRYAVRWCRSEDAGCDATNGTSPEEAAVPASDEGFAVEDLQNCATYLVWVAAVGAGGVESEPSFAHVRAGYTGGDEPIQNLQVSRVSSQEAYVTWDSPRDAGYCVIEYQACLEEHYETGGSQPLSCSSLPSSRGYWSSEFALQPCTLYTLTVSPRNFSGDWIRNYTVSFLTGPGGVRSLSEAELAPLVSEVRWKAPLSRTCLERYRICWQPAEGGEATCDTAPASATAFNVTDEIQGCSSYVAAVTAVGVAGDLNGTSDPSEVAFTTMFADPGGVVDLRCGVSPSNAIRARWGEPERNATCVDDYEVCLRPSSGPGEPRCELVSRSLSSWTSDAGLAACADYNVSVAYRHATAIVDVASVVQRTGPAQVEDLAVDGRTATSMSVSWKNPAVNADCAEEAVVSWCYQEPGSQLCRPSDDDSGNVTASETRFNITDLLPCSNYTVRVAVVTAGNLTSPYSAITQHTSDEEPSAVSNVSLRQEGSSTLLTWSAPSLAWTCTTGYQVCWWRLENQAAPVCGHAAGESFPIDQQLVACDVYEASVRAAGADGWLSEAANVTIDRTAPGKVENLAVPRSYCRSLAIEWDVPLENGDCVSRYEVCWSEPPSGNSSCIQVPYEEIDMVVAGLRPRSAYRISVAAVGPAGAKSEESVVEADTGPAQVEDLAVDGRTSTSMSVSWKNPAVNADCAEEAVVSWCYQEPGSQLCRPSDDDSGNVTASETRFNITDLLPCSNYTVRVAAVTAGDLTSPYSAITQHTSDEAPGEVSDLAVASRTTGSIAVSWLPPPVGATCLTGYEICHAVAAGGGNASCERTSTEVTERNITGLRPGARYAVTLTALGPGDQQSAANTVQAVTDGAGGGNGGQRPRTTWNTVVLVSAAAFLLGTVAPVMP